MKANEFQLRDNTGRELAVYDMNTGRVKYYNLFGNGSLGRAEANWDSIWVEDPRSQNPGYWSYSRTDSRYYYIKDHLGSIRITIDETGNVVNAQDYYSFGGILRSYKQEALSGERYKFTGKERDTETNYDYFGARYYDSDLGRWLTPDPLADKYPGWSPYNYCLNNPLKLVDPDGNDPGLAAAAVAVAAGAALGVGITLYATYEVTKNYLEHPSSVNIPNQSTVMGVALGYANSVYNTVSNWFSSDNSTQNATEQENTNPYDGPVDKPVKVVDENGNVIPVDQGEQIKTSPDGTFVDVKKKDGKTSTGKQIHRGHKETTHKDPRALKPHAHVPGVSNSDGTPWLPLRK